MKTISTVRFRPKPEHFDLVADKLKQRADHWASRGTTAKVYLVQDDDELGRITFSGDDGTDINSEGAKIVASVDGTPGSNDMPGRLTFSTTADGASTVTERLRIASHGNIEVKGGNLDFQQQNNGANAVNGSLIFSNAGTSQVSRITGYTGSSADDGDIRFYTKNGGTETEALRGPNCALVPAPASIVTSDG